MPPPREKVRRRSRHAEPGVLQRLPAGSTTDEVGELVGKLGLLRRVLRDGHRVDGAVDPVIGAGDGRRSAVLVTHDPLDALTLADRVLVFTDGAVVEQGPTRRVLGTPRSAFAARIAGLDLVAGVACADGLRTADGTVLAGHCADVTDGDPVVAVFAPSAVAVHPERPHGSPRNAFPARVDGLAADVTLAAVADLGLEPGMPAWFAVKAAEVVIHPA